LIQAVPGWSQQNYAVTEIPEELRKDVHVVVRRDQMIYTLLDKNRATLSVKLAATIFNKNGRGYAQPVVGYNKLSKVNKFNGSVYDSQGKLIRKLKNSEIEDRSAYDGFSLYSDYRTKSADLTHGDYPYTVEFEYDIEYRYVYVIPGSSVVPNEKISVQEFSYQLVYPPSLKPRYKLVNLDQSPKVEQRADGMESLTWTFKNVSPIKLEPYGPLFHQQVPQILAAPSQFEYEGYAGDMSTWESYGKWEAKLNEGRDVLPPATQEKVISLTRNLSTTEEKAKVLYEYLQSKTRYVSISLGIGGLQPFEASVVDQVGYGDCKALSNYMVALLKVAGIKGYYSTIKAGEFREDLMLDFPSHQGNHVIVAVPNGADTLWLECTSQSNPFGYLGSFTGNRKAFMLTEHGAVWANTTRYTHEHNLQQRTANVYVDATGNARATVTTRYTGLQYENGGLDKVLNSSHDDQKKWVQNTTDIASFDVNTFSLKNEKGKMPVASVELDLTLRRYSTVSGKRMFLMPNLMNRVNFIPEQMDNRTTPVFRRVGYTDMDTIRFHIPESLYPEFLPDPIQIKSRFGEYEASVRVDQDGIMYIRKMIIFKGEYPKESYTEMIDFYKAVTKADNTKLVFLTKT
jgi:transglutaminase-like putative cysteine protease